MDKAKIRVMDGAPSASRPSGVGHYFDQAMFDLHYLRLAMRAERMAMEAELAAAGIEVDADGQVTLKAADG